MAESYVGRAGFRVQGSGARHKDQYGRHRRTLVIVVVIVLGRHGALVSTCATTVRGSALARELRRYGSRMWEGLS
jgi:hypothetical protein